ncbi:Sec-independent protein translocase subunit TatA [Arsenicicoccus dermatophilus]|nr:Sec-independent protein translocase subunit TatA [Arsenicicoccus dermatophilus]MCH8612488.1 Sec-independent protein translocase subunit TatA [Arsenicicoccus dermatophilus]
MGIRGLFEGWHLVILIIVILLVFGANRLPDAARSLGRSLRIFKTEVDEMHKDGTSEAARTTVDGDVVTERTTTTTRTETAAPAAGASKATGDDDYVVIDGVRYRREGGDTAPRA